MSRNVRLEGGVFKVSLLVIDADGCEGIDDRFLLESLGRLPLPLTEKQQSQAERIACTMGSLLKALEASGSLVMTNATRDKVVAAFNDGYAG